MAPVAGETTIIGRTVRIRGRVTGTADLEIEGFVEGEVTLEGELTIGESGRVGANVHARTVIVRGAIRGDVHADDVVRLESGARVVGDVRAPRVSIAPGAKVRGFVQTAGSGSAAPRATGARAATTAPATRAASPAPAAVKSATPAASPAPSTAAQAAPVRHVAGAFSAPAPAPTPTVKQAAAAPVHAAQARSGPPAPVVPVIKKAKGQLTKKRGE